LFSVSQLPNLISLLRLALAPVFAWLVVKQRFSSAMLVGIFAGITDWLDGYAARKLKVRTETGTYLDPAADKTLLVVAFLSLGWARQIPAWLVALVMGRDVVIVVGVVLLWKFRGRTDFPPLLSGKVSTFFQIVTVVLVLLNAVFPSRVLFVLRFLGFVCTAFFTALSGINYIRRGIEMTRRQPA
jgi:cardiolipin synthase (CMP-forming)